MFNVQPHVLRILVVTVAIVVIVGLGFLVSGFDVSGNSETNENQQKP
jgi:hypothetical protein